MSRRTPKQPIQDKYTLLNKEMDKLAKPYWEETRELTQPPQQIISDREWSVLLTIGKSQGTFSILSNNTYKWLVAAQNAGREPRN
jgi:hypothetical protein